MYSISWQSNNIFPRSITYLMYSIYFILSSHRFTDYGCLRYKFTNGPWLQWSTAWSNGEPKQTKVWLNNSLSYKDASECLMRIIQYPLYLRRQVWNHLLKMKAPQRLETRGRRAKLNETPVICEWDMLTLGPLLPGFPGKPGNPRGP